MTHPVVADLVQLLQLERLEDNLYLSKGVYASNAQLVTKARTIIEAMGAKVMSVAATRDRLGLK